MSVQLSVCMIVRNESHNLEAALRSVRDVADEVIVVDTGSTDDTCAIAIEWGARLFHDPWDDDFSKARNAALEAASGDWVLSLDADERLAAGQQLALRELLQQPLDAYFVQVHSAVTERSNQRTFVHLYPRLFRRDPRIRYCRRVHEQISEALEAMRARTAATRIRIDHEGYAASAEVRMQKLHRNLRLLRLEENGRSDDPAVHFHLGETLALLGDAASAVTHYQRCLTIGGLPHDHHAAAHQNLASAHLALGRWADAVASAERALECEPALRTPLLIRASARVRMQEFDAAIADVDHYLRPERPETSLTFGFELDRAKALLVRAESNLRAQRVAEAGLDAAKLLRSKPDWGAAQRLMSRICAAKGEPGAELQYMERACALEPDNEMSWKELVAMHVRRQDLDGAQRCVERALFHKRTAALLRLRAWLRFQRQDVDGALESLRDALHVEPQHADTRARIAELERLAQRIGERT